MSGNELVDLTFVLFFATFEYQLNQCAAGLTAAGELDRGLSRTPLTGVEHPAPHVSLDFVTVFLINNFCIFYFKNSFF